MMLTPGPKKGKKKDYDPFMLLAKYKAGGKSTPKKQLGGLGNMFGIDTGTLNGIMSGLEGVDFNNYQSVLGAGEKIGGQNFMDAIAADDPSKIGGLQAMSAALAKSQKPVWTPGTPEYNAEFDRRVAERGVDTIPNGRDRTRVKSMIHEEMKREGQRNAQFGQRTQTINNMAGATGQAAGLNSLLGIIDGFQFQQGGAVSKLGYSDNSPYKNLPAINIPGNIITMAGTGQPIMAIPNAGQPAMMPPYSGTHVFPGATSVLEIPVPKKKKGGKKKWSYYQEGGLGLSIGAQLERGEVFATPNVDIIDTNATELHKDMPSETVTDILGGEDYVFSVLPSHKITRKQAEELSDKVGGVLYEEGKIKELPKPYGPIDLFREGEKEVNVAEFVKRIRSRYKVRPEETEDPFIRKTNAANKESRIPLLQVAAAVNEMKRGGNEMSGYASTFENKFKDSPLADALPVRKAGTYAAFDSTEQVQQAMAQAVEGQPTEMRDGGPPKMVLGAIASLIPAAAEAWQGILGNSKKQIPIRQAATQAKIDAYDQAQAQKLANVQQAWGMLPALAQFGQAQPAMPMVENDPTRMQDGGLFGPIMAGVQFLGGVFGGINQNNISRNNYNTIRKALANDRQEIDKLAKSQSAFNVASAVPVLGALAAQNPIVDAIKSDTSQLDATVRRMPRSYFDMAMARMTANTRPYLSALANNASNFGQIVTGAAPVVAANATAMANMGMQEAQQNIQMENAYRMQKQQYLDRDIANEVSARNATRSNSNTLLSGLGATLSGTVARQGSIETDKINAIRDNRMQLAQAEMNRRSQRGQAFNQILGGASQAANTLYSDQLLRDAYGPNNRSTDPGTTNPIVPTANAQAVQTVSLPSGQYTIAPNGTATLTSMPTPYVTNEFIGPVQPSNLENPLTGYGGVAGGVLRVWDPATMTYKAVTASPPGGKKGGKITKSRK